MGDPLDRDDVLAAVFAAEINQGLRDVDSKTTSRPLQTPPAARLDPKSLLRPDAPPAVSNPPPQTPFGPANIKDILIPLPDGMKLPSPTPPTPTKSNSQQLELNLPTTDVKKPSSAPEWFEYLDKRLDGLKFDIYTLTNRVIELKQAVLAKKQRKPISKEFIGT